VILIHGGGWRGGERSSERPVAEALARAGIVALAVDYRLATDSTSKYPAQLDDVQRAVRWTRAHAAELGIDPTRIGAFGHSAGGHLAALLGTRETRIHADPELAAYSSRVSCVVDTAGPADFTDPAHPAVWPAHQHLVTFWLGAPREEAPDRYRDASPLAHVGPDSARFLILHGTRDEFVPIDQSRRLHAALRAAGVEATLIELDDVHLFQKPENQRRWIEETVRFFETYLGPTHRQASGM
jgi:acetyl esterase/lipase